MKNVRYQEMNDILKSSDFQHPDTGVPICFVWDGVAELLWQEPCEEVCEQWDVPSSEYNETVDLCKQWGERACAFPAEANRIIQSGNPELMEDGIYFPED